MRLLVDNALTHMPVTFASEPSRTEAAENEAKRISQRTRLSVDLDQKASTNWIIYKANFASGWAPGSVSRRQSLANLR